MIYVIGFYLMIGLAMAIMGKEQLVKDEPAIGAALQCYPLLGLLVLVILTIYWPLLFTVEFKDYSLKHKP